MTIFKIRSYEEENPWYWRYRINISTNGVNYSDNAVQRLIENNKGKISIGITLMEQKKSMIFREYFQMGQDLMMLSIKILNCGWSSSQEVLK